MSLLGLNKLTGKIAQVIGVKFLTSKLKDAADGKLGEGWKKAYWYTVGKKRVVGIGVLISSLVLMALGYLAAAGYMALLAGVFISAGMIDANWREEAIDDIHRSKVYVFMADNATEIVAVTGYVAYQLSACSVNTAAALSHIYLSCDSAEKILAAFILVSAQLGLNFAANKAPRPEKKG